MIDLYLCVLLPQLCTCHLIIDQGHGAGDGLGKSFISICISSCHHCAIISSIVAFLIVIIVSIVVLVHGHGVVQVRIHQLAVLGIFLDMLQMMGFWGMCCWFCLDRNNFLDVIITLVGRLDGVHPGNWLRNCNWARSFQVWSGFFSFW